MTLVKIKNLFLMISLFFLSSGCNESVDTPPFTFDCRIRFIDQDGNSLLQNNKEKINEIAVKMIEPSGSDTKASVEYLELADFSSIQVCEWKGGIKNDGNRLQNYIIHLQIPEVFSKHEKDTIKLSYQFKNYTPSVIEGFFNDEKPESMTTELTVFKIIR